MSFKSTRSEVGEVGLSFIATSYMVLAYQLSFYLRCLNKQLHVTATFGPRSDHCEGKEQLKDFQFVAPSSKSLPSVPFVNRPTRQVASLDSQTRKKHVLLLQEIGADERIRENYVPNDKVPIRQYFHSKTYQPMIGGDWDVDSDEDSTTDKWHRDITSLVSPRRHDDYYLW